MFTQSAFWQINKNAAKKLQSNDAAILLSELIDKYSYFKGIGQLVKFKDKDGKEIAGEFFAFSSENIEGNTNIAYKKQKSCIAMLEKHGLIHTILRGQPAILHFAIFEKNIYDFVNSK